MQGAQHPFKAVRSEVRLPERFDDPRCFAKIREWIEHCDREHKQCQQVGAPGMPTRVLDVQSLDPDGNCRIHVTGEGEGGQYAALSHCWGDTEKTPVFKTTTDKLDEFKQLLPFNRLPRSFQDAIRITRTLGLRYLWIDALCIVQDDAQDWANEAPKMAEVYSRAYVTLSLAAATNSSEGCLNAREGKMEQSLRTGNDSNAGLFLRLSRYHAMSRILSADTQQASKGMFEDFEELDRGRILETAPVFTRKWCFQERMLSRRTVHYSREEMVWECAGGMKCECGIEVSNVRRKTLAGSQRTRAPVGSISRLQELPSERRFPEMLPSPS